MDWTFGGLPDWVITTAVGVLAAVLIYLGRYRLGLGEVQLATASEREKLLGLYEKRIKMLEEDSKAKDDRIRWLEAENTQLERRMARLEKETHVATGPE